MKSKDCVTEKVLFKGKISNLTHNYRVQALFSKYKNIPLIEILKITNEKINTANNNLKKKTFNIIDFRVKKTKT